MNQDTIVQFLSAHGPVRDVSPTRANAIKRSWEIAQGCTDIHAEYACSEAAWSFHVKNAEQAGQIIVERRSPRISTSIDVARKILKSDEPTTVLAEPTPAPQDLVVSIPDVVVSGTAGEPMVQVQVELPAGRAAQMLAELSELPLPAALEPSQITVLVDGYREMTEQLQNFVSETFAAWIEMTEKIDRIEGALADTKMPVTTEVIVDVDGSEPSAPAEKPAKPLRPRLSAVPNSVGDKELRNLYGHVAAQGYDIEHSRGGHIKMIPQNGVNGQKTLIGPATPSDHRSIKNLRAQLRRAGVELP